jgi:pimeloyl-ACP methyl ester carboxylesterase
LWATARSTFSEGHPFHAPDARVPGAVFGLAAITDMASYAAGNSSCEQSVVELLGKPEDQGHRYQAVSPLECLPLGVPTLLAQGLDDPIVPLMQAESFLQDARAAGDHTQMLELPDAGHFDLIHPRTAAWRAILDTLGDCL